ncbi:hypothetical protein [Halorhabdus salina]|uniref:hypothetical protein n=1 Tax=Halorhabdus salina TaxID=2750670 RepID=UPI0015EF6BE2|nr:hypothetical protein [Halorhabdus salina]
MAGPCEDQQTREPTLDVCLGEIRPGALREPSAITDDVERRGRLDIGGRRADSEFVFAGFETRAAADSSQVADPVTQAFTSAFCSERAIVVE